MPGTTTNLGLPYPDGGDGPDGPGAVEPLAAKLDIILGGGTFAAGIGAGGSTGSNGGSDGKFLQIGRHVFARGRVVFGSSASWGTLGAATLSNLPIDTPLDQRWSNGHGRFIAAGGAVTPVMFQPHPNGTELYISPIMGASSGSPTSLGNAFQIGSIPQSSVLTFSLDLVCT